MQTGVSTIDEVTDLVMSVYTAIRTPFECAGHQLTTDASIGIALAPEHGLDLNEILKNADLAMYAAKSAGRRTCRFFDPEMDVQARARRTLELDLRQAIARGELEVYYQPCVSLQDGRITGCEALVRWRHPERGMVSPGEFIPIAEETGLINEIGEWVLATACADAAKWPNGIRLAVNVSPVQFRSATLALKVTAALAASGLSASRLELEITEAVLIRDDDTALAILHQLRAIGVRIALDDFGTGYSSLSYLQRFPFDKIKIDRAFVVGLAERRRLLQHRAGGGEHRRRPQHDDHGGRRRDRGAAPDAARARLLGDAGLSVQPAQAARPDQGAARRAWPGRRAASGARHRRLIIAACQWALLPKRCGHDRRTQNIPASVGRPFHGEENNSSASLGSRVRGGNRRNRTLFRQRANTR